MLPFLNSPSFPFAGSDVVAHKWCRIFSEGEHIVPRASSLTGQRHESTLSFLPTPVIYIIFFFFLAFSIWEVLSTCLICRCIFSFYALWHLTCDQKISQAAFLRSCNSFHFSSWISKWAELNYLGSCHSTVLSRLIVLYCSEIQNSFISAVEFDGSGSFLIHN